MKQLKLICLIGWLCLLGTAPLFAQGVISGPQNTETQHKKSNNSKKTKLNKGSSISKEDGVVNGFGYVDLGLPSGLKWATSNIGAINPSEYGDFYSWGNISLKFEYSPKTTNTLSKNHAELQSDGIIYSDGILTDNFDVARCKLGSTWRIPTNYELEELERMCKWIWTTYKNCLGYKVIGPNGKSIFLPAAGYKIGTSHYNVGDGCWLWSSKVYNDKWNAYCLGKGNSFNKQSWKGREHGLTVRPVSK